jgi:hypothetical protein
LLGVRRKAAGRTTCRSCTRVLTTERYNMALLTLMKVTSNAFVHYICQLHLLWLNWNVIIHTTLRHARLASAMAISHFLYASAWVLLMCENKLQRVGSTWNFVPVDSPNLRQTPITNHAAVGSTGATYLFQLVSSTTSLNCN